MCFKWFKRRKQARGFGIHSPFAYNFVTHVVNEEYGYTAFLDIDQLLRTHNIETADKKLHHLSYRLVRYFKPGKILELDTGKGVNTLYISAASKDAVCHCFDPEGKNVLQAGNLHTTFNRYVEFIDEIDLSELYDGIFVYLNTFPVDMESLLSMSSDDTFWVIAGIKSGNGKHFWKAVVADERARITFDMKDIGVVVLKKSYHKANYLI
ncbi:MAG: hypothetical protein VB075_16345 [Petrimonas sp.]|uniref:hypothetical protein n=1 Tax=Petrimonas sp. TaxID=2023866 RepID=UPI002B375353|nr:hypothetical protein [Petrimonas sp.]MEA5046124.1 hypothetical protein [Petrimonas sp.]HMM17827.1 hypothetical protein [Petrimonas sp.]